MQERSSTVSCIIFRGNLSALNGVLRPGIIHRIDKGHVGTAGGSVKRRSSPEGELTLIGQMPLLPAVSRHPPILISGRMRGQSRRLSAEATKTEKDGRYTQGTAGGDALPGVGALRGDLCTRSWRQGGRTRSGCI